MKHLFHISTLFLLLTLTPSMVAQNSSSVLSIGLRGGGNTYLTGSGCTPKLGGLGGLDLGYTQYWIVNGDEIGFRTGLGVAYASARFDANYTNSFTRQDYLGNTIQYQVSCGSIINRLQQIQLEIPLLFAIRADQVFINVGAKFMMPVWHQSAMTSNPISIDAYYPQWDVHITNEVITGQASSEQLQQAQDKVIPQYNVFISLEAGYEWQLDKGNIGLGLFFDISPWSSFSSTADLPLIDVGAIENPYYPPAKVTINSVTTCLCRKMLPVDFGLKLYYALEYENIRRYGLHRH